MPNGITAQQKVAGPPRCRNMLKTRCIYQYINLPRKKMPIIITAQQKVAGPPGCRSKLRQMFAPFPIARVMLLLFEYNACYYYSSNIGVMLLLFE